MRRHSHSLELFAQGALELMYPTRCVACELPGNLLCQDCINDLAWISQRWACPQCGAPFGYLTCTECERNWPLHASICAMTFSGAAASMVTKLKDAHELRLAPIIAAAMEAALLEASAWTALDGTARVDIPALDAIAFVPATHEAYMRRGFDHMELVSQQLSQLLSIPVLDALVRTKAKDQRKLTRQERAHNLKGSVQVLKDVSSLQILLIDDVITTGASICECSRALLGRGASSITACSLARVWQ